ncbi:MAG: RNA polymerase factor sigma-54 [Chromatiales bacterium]|nr:RNA polymerase factor sigma-54 [Chromatiales bacterium]
MKQSLQLRIGQQLTITPQLQQAIRMLQLSTLELSTEIQQVLETNPMLELDEFESGDEPAHDEPDGRDGPDEVEFSAPDDAPTDAREEMREDIPDELPVDSVWDDVYEASLGGQGGESERAVPEDYLARSAATQTLHDYLYWQLNLAPFSARDRAIAQALIDGINDDGYLESPLDDIALSVDVSADDPIEPDEVAAVLKRVQAFDPAGVGARDLRECLLLQLRQLSPETHSLALALTLVEDHLDELPRQRAQTIAQRLGASDEEFDRAIALIRAQNPRPGSTFAAASIEYIVPDVIVRRSEHGWRVELNNETMPKLRINRFYQGLVRRNGNADDASYLRDRLQEARWFLKSLASRNETLLRVASAIVEHQREFLERGDEAMRPLVLREIADSLSLHESTVSRVTMRKYMHTPRGVYELKYFFSSHVTSENGETHSATAVRALIRQLVSEEPPAKPLSDNRIAVLLSNRGVEVARRTVAKYREAMAIPPSNERKRLA